MSDQDSATIRPLAGFGDLHSLPSGAQRRGEPAWAEFERIVADERDRVARLASRLLGWRSDVDDVVQDVFLRAWRGWSGFRQESSVKTWLTRITINACRARLRAWSAWLRVFSPADAEEPIRSAAAQDGTGMHAESLRRVRDGVRALPRKLREVIVLRYLEDYPIAQIAAVLGVSEGAVEVRLHRARARLRDALGALWEQER
ncbi:MAG: sigma-70 family RNA polymerase sigma factor [Planctomycetota bacterium]|nr:MAG: sigma-70 family RNA polymerase sigma factor [Planctomycetota bacterium]